MDRARARRRSRPAVALPGLRRRLTLPSGGELELQTDDLATEPYYLTTVDSAALNALFLSDLGYNRVHHWLGDDISSQDSANWQQQLRRPKREYVARAPKIYPSPANRPT